MAAASAILAAFLAASLSVSAFLKVVDIGNFRRAIDDYSVLQRLPGVFRRLALALIPTFELAVGIVVIVPRTRNLGAVAAGLLFFVFFVVIRADSREAFTNCGCASASAIPLPKSALLSRDALFLGTSFLLAIIVNVAKPSPATLTTSLSLLVPTLPLACASLELPHILHVFAVDRENMERKLALARLGLQAMNA